MESSKEILTVAFKKYRSLNLDGRRYDVSELKAVCREKLSRLSGNSWEYKFYDFISGWFDDSPTIRVKTSGTTGTPKEIAINKDRMLQSALMTIRHLQIPPGDHALLCLSCEHIAGKMMVVRAFAGDLNLIPLAPSSNPLKIVPVGTRIDFAAFVPLQVNEILNDQRTVGQLASIKHVLIGGGVISPKMIKKLSAFSNNIYETYGMTETISHIALKKLSGKPDYFFQTLENITVKTDSRDCLVINAPQISNKPITTNDVVELKDNSHFRWLGRYDNVVNSGGIKLFPEALEEKITGLTERRYFFTGKPDDKLGEKLILVIEGEPLPETELNQLNIDLQKNLSKYEMPKEIIFIAKFNLTESGKIQREITVKSGMG